MTAEPRARPRLLLVEDYALGRAACARLLAQCFRVTAVDDGDEALRCAGHAPFDVVLADFRMPVMNGIELFEHLRLLEPHLRRVLMSCAPVPGLVGYSTTGLVQGFLAKPFDLQTACTVLHPEAFSASW
jgi:two-component system response regulator GlrR